MFLSASVPTFTGVLTTGMLEPLTTAITSNLGVLVPWGIGIMGTMLGISLIPRILYKFF